MISGEIGEAFDLFDAAGHDERITGGNHSGIEMLPQATGRKPSADTARAQLQRATTACVVGGELKPWSTSIHAQIRMYPLLSVSSAASASDRMGSCGDCGRATVDADFGLCPGCFQYRVDKGSTELAI
ncbi:hypothetical protein AB0H42_30090 [Nocardia sp. NPDC050799]|uniref:hypothetical protein n=1 Tax=Nocardia sp. NPDC050799 TaxID=3154842 RepID=UPI0033DE31E6